ncbi:MAG: tRNA (adenosine(37)-N6)-threonylcarbamoyltransferase complex dimerization subunit type 1 TsaB [Chromatiales bacterium]|jgi:tRNA threonylcarbamoyladenosine biosynthesis protein TsaB|nr:tRNA (adenosine(37)-N6)-threonylcarbamoyltransferase complex dimerization subunit type 1 TsaB [Chromatiales bacterium]
MKLLALETSTIACSAALLIDGEIRERYEIAPRRHADLLLPMLDALLAEAGITPRDLDALAFGRGPGAFTGLRIAAAVAQGVAFAADLPVVPVSTLAALAQDGVDDGAGQRILTAMDARIGEVYWGAFEVGTNGLVVARDEERVCAPEEVSVPEGDNWYGVGDGLSAYAEALTNAAGEALRSSDAARWPRARAVARLAAHDYARELAVPAVAALPVYLRERVASTTAERALKRAADEAAARK